MEIANIFYIAGCFAFAAYLLFHAPEDDDVTVSDGLRIVLIAFLPPLNLLAIAAIFLYRFKASGSDFSDRILLPRRRRK